MLEKIKRPPWFSGNVLKIIALIAMTFDHIGYHLYPQFLWLRVIGRLAFPIFAYMIAEGCFYTRNRKKYIGLIGIMGFGMQVIEYIAEKEITANIFITFFFSITVIYLFDYVKTKKKVYLFLLFGYLLVLFFIFGIIPTVFKSDFGVDYGVFGLLLPFFVYLGKTKQQKILLFGFGLIPVIFYIGWVQWFSVLTIPLIALYNGKKGKLNIKYLFYIYYPLHLLIIIALKTVLK